MNNKLNETLRALRNDASSLWKEFDETRHGEALGQVFHHLAIAEELVDEDRQVLMSLRGICDEIDSVKSDYKLPEDVLWHIVEAKVHALKIILDIDVRYEGGVK